jgi:hypothetical protein
MVKRIKKRIPKPETPELSTDAVDAEVSEGLRGAESAEGAAEGAVVVGAGAEAGAGAEGAARRAPRAAVVVEPNISMSYGDSFTDVAERLLHAVHAQWQVLAGIAVVGALVWGVIVKFDEAAHESQAEERVALSAAASAYASARAPQVAYLKRGARWAEENPSALTTPDIGEAPSADALKGAAERFKALQGELSHNGTRALARLGEASARFDAAKTADEFKVAAALYEAVGADEGVDLFARAIAHQSAAAAHEQAALRAGDEAAKGASWASAAAAWGALSQLDPEIYGLFAGTERARVLLASGDAAGASALVGSLETVHAETLKDTKRKAEQRALTLLKAQAAR